MENEENTGKEQQRIRGFTVLEAVSLCFLGGVLCGFILGAILTSL
jgi:hypothetical protein